MTTSEVSVCDPRTQLAEKIRSLSSKARFNEASKEELFELSALAHEAADLYDQLYGLPGDSRLVERFAPRDIGLSIGDVLMANAGSGAPVHIRVTRTGISRAGCEEADFESITTGPRTGPSGMSTNDTRGLWEHMRDHGWRRLSRERVCYCGAPATLECECEPCAHPGGSRQWTNYVTGELTRVFLCCEKHIPEVSARHRHVLDRQEPHWGNAKKPDEPMLMSAEAAEIIENSSHSHEPFTRVEAAEVKSHLEAREDKFRPPYGENAANPTKFEAAWNGLVDALDDLATKHKGRGEHDHNLGASLRALWGLATELRAKALAGVTS